MDKPSAPVGVRVFRKLRVSLTRSCNFGCVYCAADGKAVVDPQITSVEKFLGWIRQITSLQDIQKIRLTGGEPTLYPDIVQLVAALKRETTARVYLTTNGHRLPHLAGPLQNAGLDGVNISLDAIEPEIFKAMGGRNYAAVIQGVYDAQDAGLSVKINSTLMSEMNEREILPLLDFAYSRGIVVRFLELMAMGHLHGNAGRRSVNAGQILEVVRMRHQVKELGRAASGTAAHYELDRGQVFGIIANNSAPFCGDCDRLRLDATGRIYGCLSNPRGISLDAGADTAKLLAEAILLKQSKEFTGSELHMREVGG